MLQSRGSRIDHFRFFDVLCIACLDKTCL